ncbi:polysaccharide pyruvyl transferase family protein [Clostridium perfringens]
MKKFGQLTFHRAANYGAVLQAYALQQILFLLNIDTEIIDYRCKHIENNYKPFKIYSRNPVNIFKAFKDYPLRKKIRINFDEFLENEIKTSKKLLNKEQMKEYIQRYDGVIVGSDQVFNMALTNNDLSYLLDFLDPRQIKASYAASFGSVNSMRVLMSKHTNKINSFNYLSIREIEESKNLEYINIKCNRLIDPVFLLSKEKWHSLSQKKYDKYKNKRYIFLYTMQQSKALEIHAKYLAKENDLEIFTISMINSDNTIGKSVKGLNVYEFIQIIEHAEYVLTNSYHAIVFSLIFRKNFFWSAQEGTFAANSRMNTLEELFGINKRIIDEKSYLCGNLDYFKIKNIINDEQKKAISYLKQISK